MLSWAAGHSWSQQWWPLLCPELGVPGTVLRHSEQTLLMPCDFCFSKVQDSLCSVGVCCPVLSWRFVCLFLSFSAQRVTFSGGPEATGECGWAGAFLCVGHGVRSSEQCLLSNGTFRWDELLVIRLIWGLPDAKPFPAPSLLSLSVNDPLFRLLCRDSQQGLLSSPAADVWPASLH